MTTDEREVSETAIKNKIRPAASCDQSVRILWRRPMGRPIFVKGHAGDSGENKTAGI